MPPAPLGTVLALSESRLDEVRGGFETSSGLQMTFGIERAVYINGALVTTPTVNVVEVGSGGAVRSVSAAPDAGSTGLALIQNGPGNTFIPGSIASSAVGTVIQNTLDGQQIQSITSINATVNSLEIMKARSFESSMRGAIVDSLRR